MDDTLGRSCASMTVLCSAAVSTVDDGPWSDPMRETQTLGQQKSPNHPIQHEDFAVGPSFMEGLPLEVLKASV